MEDWRGYGLKVRGMYDNGNDDWLDNKSKNAKYNIAYIGINNFLGDSREMVSNLKNFSNINNKNSSDRNSDDRNNKNSSDRNSDDRNNKNSSERNSDDRNNKNSSDRNSNDKNNKNSSDRNSNDKNNKNPSDRRSESTNNDKVIQYLKNKNYIDGVLLFQNPKYAENAAGIINVCGYQIKVIIMCKVKINKIRKQKNFEDCWILNPTPDEVRPYRILIKIIPNSPLTDGSFSPHLNTPEIK